MSVIILLKFNLLKIICMYWKQYGEFLRLTRALCEKPRLKGEVLKNKSFIFGFWKKICLETTMYQFFLWKRLSSLYFVGGIMFLIELFQNITPIWLTNSSPLRIKKALKMWYRNIKNQKLLNLIVSNTILFLFLNYYSRHPKTRRLFKVFWI